MRSAQIVLSMILAGVLLLAGCQQQQEPISKDKNEVKAEEQRNEKSYSLTGQEMEKEPAGEFYEKYIKDKTDAGQEQYQAAADKAVASYMDMIEKEDTSDWDEKNWAQSIVTSFRTDVSDVIQPIKEFKVEYHELKMPDGRLLQDVDEEELEEEPDQVNVAVLIDGSGSMKADVPGGNKMMLAKSSIQQFAKDLPEGVQLSLTAFGHKGTGSDEDKMLSCSSIETVYPLEAYQEEKFNNSMEKFGASGWTPLGAAIKQAADELLKASDEHTKTVIYVVSDGIETCDGNPVQAAKEAKEAISELQVNIIGFDVGSKEDQQLKEVAKAGGGEYSAVSNKQELSDEITNKWKDNMSKTTWRFWFAGNLNSINWASVGMSNELRSLQNQFINRRNAERDLMTSVLNELVEKEKMDLDTNSSVIDLLYEREEALKEYGDGILNEKHEEIYDTADSLKRKLKHVTEDMDL